MPLCVALVTPLYLFDFLSYESTTVLFSMFWVAFFLACGYTMNALGHPSSYPFLLYEHVHFYGGHTKRAIAGHRICVFQI